MKSFQITHCLDQESISKKIVTESDIGFLLTNNLGGFLWLSDQPNSHYQGWFFVPQSLVGKKMFKIIESIQIKNSLSISEIKNNFWNIEAKRGKIKESFFLFSGFNSLVYEVGNIDREVAVDLFLDIRDVYKNPEWGRDYRIYFEGEKDVLIIEYRSQELGIPSVFLAIKSSEVDIKEIKNWVLRNYSYDIKRQDSKEQRWVFQACQMNFQKKGRIVFSVSENKEKVIAEVKYVYQNLSFLKQREKDKTNQQLTAFLSQINIPSKEKRMSYICAFDSLRKMTLFSKLGNKKGLIKSKIPEQRQGIFAGLPWFFQFWTRDEAICLKSFFEINKTKAKQFLFKELELIDNQGHIDGSSDGAGWVFKRASDFLDKDAFNKKEKQTIKQKLEKCIDGLLKYYTHNGLALSLPQQTWMDTLQRDGARIEIQSLRLNMYQLAFRLFKQIKYAKLEKQLRKQVQEKFWNGKYLADGLNPKRMPAASYGAGDFTIRPNIFLAAYIYPELLKKKEWLICFENILSKLWCNWGGITTIDKTSPLFAERHSGENSQSYHNGDSWFWVNNLTAIVLYNFDKKKFQKYINKILEISSNDILWQGIIGHHSELSSAGYFQAQGSLAQSWSSALYLEFALTESI